MSKKQELNTIDIPEDALLSDDVFDSILDNPDHPAECVSSYKITDTSRLPTGGRLDRLYRSLVFGGKVYVEKNIEFKIKDGLVVRFNNRQEYNNAVVYEK